MVDENDNSGSRTLARGLALLEGVAADPNGAGVTELAAATNLDKGTVSRLLSALKRLGYVRQDQKDRRYLLTGKVMMLAHNYDRQLNLIEVARPILQDLQKATSQTIYLAVREGDRVLYVDQYDPDSDLRLAHAIGRSLPLHVTAMGRAILAAMPKKAVETILADLLPHPANAGFDVDIEHIRDDISRARENGWATVDRFDDITRIGAAVVDSSGEPVGAISVAGPSFQIHVKVEHFGELCIQAARDIARGLGRRDGHGGP